MKNPAITIICISFFLLIFNSNVSGQSTDSSILKQINIAKNLIETDVPAALDIANKAFIEAKENDFDRGMAECYLVVGRCYIQRADEMARKSLEIALKYSEKIKDKALISDCYFYLGKSCFVNGDTKSQLEWYNKAYEIRKSLKDEKRIADSYHAFGNVYLKLNQDSMAENYFLLAKEIREKITDVPGLAAISNNLAIIAEHRGDTLLYRSRMQQAIQMNEQNGNKRYLATNHGNLGMSYLETGNYDSAWHHCYIAFEIRKTNDFKDHLAGSYGDLGKIRLAQKRYAEALGLFKQGVDLAKSISGTEWLIGNYLNMAETYKAMDSLDQQKQYSQLADELQKEHEGDTLLSKTIPPPPAFDFQGPKNKSNWMWWSGGATIILCAVAFRRLRKRKS